MKYHEKPFFLIKENLQKTSTNGEKFTDVVTLSVLKDICARVTKSEDFEYKIVDADYRDEFFKHSYAMGRFIILFYKDEIIYICFSERKIGGRDSGVQSVPTAFNSYYANKNQNKRILYYFVTEEGNPGTSYYLLSYRLMKTIGFEFINPEFLGDYMKEFQKTHPKTNLQSSYEIKPFVSFHDIVNSREVNSNKNKSNNSTYLTINSDGQFEIYAKTYGANKYASSLLCYAAFYVLEKGKKVTLYEINEQNLDVLPESSLNVINDMGAFIVVSTNIQMEKKNYEENDSLLSPRYISNLFDKFGIKHCAMCGCEIPEIIQGAHIWPVSDIKRQQHIAFEEKLQHAISGDNGLWLCENHHKLFDQNIISITHSGSIMFSKSLSSDNATFLSNITTYRQLPEQIMTEQFVHYLDLRNKAI